jgi:cyanophycin synthetase
MLRRELVESGVDDGRIAVVPDEVDAVNAALDLAARGDLVVIFGDNIERCWKQVAGHQVEAGEASASEGEKPVQSFVQEDPEAFKLEPGSELVRDERGVRIARVDEESD